jgi:hypothetical protein
MLKKIPVTNHSSVEAAAATAPASATQRPPVISMLTLTLNYYLSQKIVKNIKQI